MSHYPKLFVVLFYPFHSSREEKQKIDWQGNL